MVQNKRNTAKGLQALVNGRYIVQDSYLDAVVYAATPSDLENLESLSPLESDFDSAWPDATEHLPPAGKEPVNRPAEAFAPNPHRSNIFEGYTFVFGDPVQFENLQAPITNAHGKALHYEVENGVTTADDIVRYMRNAAGNKDLRARDGPGVVLVRFRAKGRYEAWSLDISDQVALATDQRVIEQREFLDAILGNDASPLCRSLPTEPAENADERDAEPTPVGQSQQQSQPEPPQPEQSQSQASESSQPRSRARSRARFVSKMKAFDDGFDMQSVPVDIPEDPEPSADTPQTQEQTPIEEDVVSDLLPGATAMKRRRAEAEGRKDTYSRMEEEPTPKPKRQKLNVREAARQHREAEEDAQRERQQAEHAALEDSGVEKLKDLAIVEEMDVPVRASQAAEDNRWDERWNGRKNFKKFRRKGDSGHSRHRLQAVIVPLEEVTRKEIGIGEHTWVTNQNQSPESSPRPQDTMSEEPAPRFQSSRVESQSSTARRSQKRAREVPDSDSEEELRFRFRRRR